MKELTIEQKAKAYDEAIEIAKSEYQTHKSFNGFREMLTRIFPELKESEDERIRKEIANYFKHYSGGDNISIEFPKWIAWLEKQAEQKPIDNVEPKFKDGDWVVNKLGDSWHIDSFNKKNYQVSDGKGKYNYFPISKQDEMHLWTIQDAKDGDVLVNQNGEMPFIFKECKDNHIYCYCGYTNRKDIFFNRFIDSEGEELHWLNLYHEQAYPATKEQRDLLLTKMKEAGYEWDAEKKELKKQEIAEIPFGAKDSELQEATYYIPKGFHAELEENKVVIKQGEQKPAWSEEDENMLRRVFDSLNTYAKGAYPILKSIVEEEIDWLESLKSRKLCIYNPYKAVVESIAKMCDKYENYMYDEKEAKDFLANVAIKCREAAEYDKKYIEK